MKLSLKDNLQEVKMTLALIAQWLKHSGGWGGWHLAERKVKALMWIVMYWA